MALLSDHRGLDVRLTDERLAHILEHPEMSGMESAIGDTLQRPIQVVQSVADPTDRIKRGTILWIGEP